MTEKIKSNDAKRLIDIHNSIVDNLVSVMDQRKYRENNVIAAANDFISDEAMKLLKGIPVEEINRDKKGFRVKSLHDNGYHTVADLMKCSLQRLKDINGISEESAGSIKSAAEDLFAVTKKNIGIKLSVDNKSPAASLLVSSVAKYRMLDPVMNEAENVYRKTIVAIETGIHNLTPAVNPIKWLFASDQKKESVTQAYNTLVCMLNGSYRQSVNDIFESCNRIQALSNEEAWEDFSQNSIRFFKIIEDLMPGYLSSDETIYGLPEDVAENVREQEYTTDGLFCELRRYQEWGVKYILKQKRVLLGDEMGLGKTVQAIASMVSLRNEGETHFMVVCPASVLSNWCREIKKMSDLPVCKVHGAERNEELEQWKENGGVAVTTYETTGSLDIGEDFSFSMLVVDEAHYIKNPDAKRTKNVTEICNFAENVLFMTGTALENKVKEMVSLIKILRPQIASQVHGMAFMASAPQFRDTVAPVYYRRKREDVLTELPDLIETKEWCSMGSVEEKAYEEAVLSGNFMAARRVSWNVDNLNDSSKAARLMEIIEEAAEEGRKVIVFSFFTDTIHKITELCSTQCYGPINGSIAPHKRQEIVDEFDKAPAGSVLVSQIQAGGTGLNIQSASVVVLCEPQFKPSIENQAISRAYRMGQTRNVLVFRLLCEDSVDEKIIDLLKNKQALFDAFADESVVAEQSIELDEKTFSGIIREEAERIGAKHNADELMELEDTLEEDILLDDTEAKDEPIEDDSPNPDTDESDDIGMPEEGEAADTENHSEDRKTTEVKNPETASFTARVVSFLKRSAAEFNELFSGELTDEEIDVIYEGLTDYDFHGIDILEDSESLDSELEDFRQDAWEQNSIDLQKEKILELAQYIIDIIGLENPPAIEFFNDETSRTYGYFSSSENKLCINEKMIFESYEAADTIAHELWHAYQFERASNPQTKLDYMYLENFNDYITANEDFEGYQTQLIEAEARAFAQQIRNRIKFKKGDSYGTDFELPA